MRFYKDIARFKFQHALFLSKYALFCTKKTEDIDSSVLYATIFSMLTLAIVPIIKTKQIENY